MKIRHCQLNRWTVIIAVAVFAVFSIYPASVFAIEGVTLPLQVVGDDVVSVSLPVVSDSEDSVFDFVLDPEGLVYVTNAVRYGGGTVEEGATLLFHNREGEYDFSKHSDWLTVTNRSTVPIQVTVTAQIMDPGDIRLTGSPDFGESTEPDVYLAIEDDKGNVRPLSADTPATIDLKMSAAPENTYVFRLDEETHTYQYGMSMKPEEVNFDTYSFRLVGACNSNAEWQNISIHPVIAVTWCVEPILPEGQEADESDEPIELEDQEVDESDEPMEPENPEVDESDEPMEPEDQEVNKSDELIEPKDQEVDDLKPEN